MNKTIFIIIFILVFPFYSYAFNPNSASIEEKLVFLNTDKSEFNIDPVKVNRFRYLLDALQKRHPESRQQIADWTVKAQGALKDNGINESLLEIMESIYSVKLNKRLGKMSYKDLATSYVMARSEGMSRHDAVQGLYEFFRGVARLK